MTTFGRSLKWVLQKTLPRLQSFCNPNLRLRQIHSSIGCLKTESHQLIVRPPGFNVPEEERNKDTFLEAVKIYTTRPGPRRGHVEFILSALKYMEEFGVHRDLQAYKDLLDILPKGIYIPTNMFQAEFFHYPKQQQCILDLLEQMEDNGVIPDAETETMVLNIFGRHGHPTKKLMRMNYWMPKFKNLSPWALPDKIPTSNLEIAKLAVRRMCSVDPASELEVFQTSELKDSIDDTWIVSGQSATQRELLAKLSEKQTVFVEGAFTIWLRRTSINYFILRTDPVPLSEDEVKERAEFDYDDVGQLRSWILGEENLTKKEIIIQPSVHEQEDGSHVANNYWTAKLDPLVHTHNNLNYPRTILAVAVTGTSSKDSLLSWIRNLEKKNPHLANLSVLFATHSPLGQVVPVIETNIPTEAQNKITDGPQL